MLHYVCLLTCQSLVLFPLVSSVVNRASSIFLIFTIFILFTVCCLHFFFNIHQYRQELYFLYANQNLYLYIINNLFIIDLAEGYISGPAIISRGNATFITGCYYRQNKDYSHNFYFLLNNTRRIDVTARNVTSEAGFMDRKFPDFRVTSFNETGYYKCAVSERTVDMSKAVFLKVPGKNMLFKNICTLNVKTHMLSHKIVLQTFKIYCFRFKRQVRSSHVT